ncbi:nucleotidyltransferase family protein [Kitasatospora sp. NPDC093550]|uniref:nucleotidyltransferase family protein n=1 Tax=Kitasatospora sp. NPDC093550 TaxID=3364089 RepID=UPI0038036B9B
MDHLSEHPIPSSRPYGDEGPLGEPNGCLPPDRTQAILEAAKRIGSLLKAKDHPFALAGGVAAYAHGAVVRLQHDADFCIRREDADAVTRTLREAGLEVFLPPEDWLVKARCLGQDVDLILELAKRPVTSELLDRAEVLPVDSVHMPVLAATDMVSALLAAFSEHHCDFGAVLAVVRPLREKIDWRRIRAERGQAPMPAAFLYLLERLQVIEPEGAGS